MGAMDTQGADPLNLGFDINIAGHAAGGLGSFLGTRNFGNHKKGGYTPPWGVPFMESYHGEDIFLTEALTLEAIKALDSARLSGKPFFLHMSHYAVHIPIEKDIRFYQKYKDKGMCETEAAYASMLEGMDKSLGDIMDYLEKNNLEENTIILFISDNGGLSAVARGGEPHTHNLPLQSGKGSAYEGGIRVPMLVKWSGIVKPGSQTEAMVIVEDFFPTILEMTSFENYNVIQEVDGISFTSVLRGNDDDFVNRKLVWHYPNNWGPSGPGIGATSTLRKGDWKLIYWYAEQRFELYNLAEDIGEQNNLAAQMPDKVSQLAVSLGSFLRDVNAMRPSFKSNGQLAPWPDE
jgi:arylsulfatase A-like enzyme